MPSWHIANKNGYFPMIFPLSRLGSEEISWGKIGNAK